MWVKICANTNLPDAQLAAELGADAVGFVLAPGRRQVTPEQVGAITPGLPGSVEKVGVFPRWQAAEIVRVVQDAGLTAAQLHTRYEPQLVQELNGAFEAHVKLIQAVAVPVEGMLDDALRELAAALRDPGLFAVLLDAGKAGQSGGLGIAFSWANTAAAIGAVRSQAQEFAEREGATVPRLLLAGGLHAGNVREAVAALRPDGLDVASGVEALPGQKSPEKLRAFIAEARRAG